MKPNLKQFNIQKLSFKTTCIIPEEILSNIKPEDEDDVSLLRFYDSYTIDRVSHLCILTLQCEDEDESEYFIEFEYSVLKRKVKLPRGIPKINNRIEILCTLNNSHNFKCSINIEYSKKDNRKFIVDLPIRMSSNSTLPISLIDGFSLKGRAESLEYSALVWTETDGDYYLIIIFTNEYTIEPSLIQHIIDDSNKISDLLLPLPK